MKKKVMICFVSTLILFFFSYSKAQKAMPQYGSVYVVKKGDTLWGISEKFYQNPLYWPIIWDSNKDKVANPHWIYPGQTLLIPYPSKIALAKQKEKGFELKLPKKEKLPLIGPEVSLYAGYISKEKIKSPYRIVSAVFDPDKSMFGEVEEVVIDIGPNAPPLAKGDLFMVVRNERKINYKGKRPVKGWEIKCLGVVRIEKVSSQKAQGVVVGASFTIMVGDLLLPYQPPDVIYELSSTPDVEGEIIRLPEEKDVAALMDYIFVNIGKKDGLKPGMVLDVYSPLGIDNVVGKLIVLKVQEDTATCYLFNARMPLEVGMKVKGAKV